MSRQSVPQQLPPTRRVLAKLRTVAKLDLVGWLSPTSTSLAHGQCSLRCLPHCLDSETAMRCAAQERWSRVIALKRRGLDPSGRFKFPVVKMGRILAQARGVCPALPCRAGQPGRALSLPSDLTIPQDPGSPLAPCSDRRVRQESVRGSLADCLSARDPSLTVCQRDILRWLSVGERSLAPCQREQGTLHGGPSFSVPPPSVHSLSPTRLSRLSVESVARAARPCPPASRVPYHCRCR
jgi:hypothetical protein